MKVISFVTLALLFFSCSDKNAGAGLDYTAYMAWINNPVNGCIVEKQVGDLILSAKLLPAPFLALKDIQAQGLDSGAYDSLLSSYSGSASFYFRLQPTGSSESSDLAYVDVTDRNEYVQRVYDMAFNMKHMFYLECGDIELEPVLFHMENDYGLSPGSSMIVVFRADDAAHACGDNWRFVFSDGLFSSGINMFSFVNKSNYPSVKF